MRSSTLAFIVFLLSLSLTAQVKDLSPYSRFGIGIPGNSGSISLMGTAGAGVASVDGIHINTANSASHAFLRSPAFEVGLLTERATSSSQNQEVTNSNTRFNHFSVAFPMWQGKWGASFGLRPYTTIGYNNTVRRHDTGTDTTHTAEYEGSGGLNRMYLDLSRKFKVGKDTSKYGLDHLLSLGVGMNYLFGSIHNDRSSLFPINSGFVSSRVKDATTINDVNFNSGILLKIYTDRKADDKDGKYSALNLGVQFNMGKELEGKRSREAYSFVENANGVEFRRDSIAGFDGRKGSLDLPSELNIGLSYDFYFLNDNKDSQRKLSILLAHRSMDWKSMRETFGEETAFSGMGTETMNSFGISYRPQTGVTKGSRGNLFKLSTYRFGMRLGDSHLEINDTVIEENGISFGMSVPLLVKGRKETDTQFDLSLSYDQRGTEENGLLEERKLSIMFGFSFHPDSRFDQWFRKRKYD